MTETEAHEGGWLDKHFSLGSLVNLVVLVGSIVGVTLYVSTGLARSESTDREHETRISTIDARLNRETDDTKRRLERIEDKLDRALQDLGNKADRGK